MLAASLLQPPDGRARGDAMEDLPVPRELPAEVLAEQRRLVDELGRMGFKAMRTAEGW